MNASRQSIFFQTSIPWHKSSLSTDTNGYLQKV